MQLWLIRHSSSTRQFNYSFKSGHNWSHDNQFETWDFGGKFCCSKFGLNLGRINFHYFLTIILWILRNFLSYLHIYQTFYSQKFLPLFQGILFFVREVCIKILQHCIRTQTRYKPLMAKKTTPCTARPNLPYSSVCKGKTTWIPLSELMWNLYDRNL